MGALLDYMARPRRRLHRPDRLVELARRAWSRELAAGPEPVVLEGATPAKDCIEVELWGHRFLIWGDLRIRERLSGGLVGVTTLSMQMWPALRAASREVTR